MTSNDLLQGVTKGAQATFLIRNGKVIWIDPFQLAGADLPKADVLFITHAHGDHLSGGDIDKIMKPETIVVGPPDCLAQITAPDAQKIAMAPGDSRTVEGIGVEAVPAYNIDKPYHPRSNNWVGFILDLGGRRVYHAGDTDRIPEMKDIRADVALLPVGGTYTMDAEEAAAAANEDIKPALAVPIHYTVVGSEADAQRFASLVTGASQVLPSAL